MKSVADWNKRRTDLGRDLARSEKSNHPYKDRDVAALKAYLGWLLKMELSVGTGKVETALRHRDVLQGKDF